MKIKVIAEMLDAKIYGNNQLLDNEVEFAFSSDLMSDVLTVKKQNILLLTGLANIQSLRTAEMTDIENIIFVRHKKITDDMIELAQENNILLMECKFSMFKASGILYNAGIKPIY